MNVVQKSFGLKVAALDPHGQEGRFAGVALVYGEKDSYGDTIRMGAFTKSITEANGKFPCLWVHQAAEVLGSIRVEQDTNRLNVSGALLVDHIAKAREVHALLKAEALKGLSVGFLPIRAAPMEGGGMEFIEGRLLEISLCPTPAFSSAQVSEVRSISDLAAALDPQRDREALMALRGTIDAMLGGTRAAPDYTELADIVGKMNLTRWKYGDSKRR